MTESPRILLVDDEAAVTRLLSTYLERLGYQVEVCSSGEEGLARFDSDPHSYDVVIADLTLTGISGDEMLRRMLAIRPALPGIVSSGYPFSVEALPMAAPRQIVFLQKPYLPNMLVEALSKMVKPPKNGKV